MHEVTFGSLNVIRYRYTWSGKKQEKVFRKFYDYSWYIDNLAVGYIFLLKVSVLSLKG